MTYNQPFRRVFRFLTLSVLTLTIFISCGKGKVQQMPPPEVLVTPAVQKDIVIYEEFVGQTHGHSDIAIRARVDGFLDGIHFQEGLMVKKGDLLYSIDPNPFEAKVAEARGGVAEAQTRLVQAKNELERYRPLAEMDAVSQKDLDAAEANYGAAQAALDAANASLKSAQIQLSYTRIKSPITGIIGKTQAKVGDYVGAAPNAVVLNAVSRIDTILVEFSIPERKYLELRRFVNVRSRAEEEFRNQERELELILADGSKHEYGGKVNFIDRQVDPATGTILLQASFPNPDGLLRPGQFARVRAAIDVAENAILVPQKSINEIQGQYNVFVVNDSSQAQFRGVEVGHTVDDMWMITSGLDTTDRVIYEGLMRIRSGVPVAPIEKKFESVNSENN